MIPSKCDLLKAIALLDPGLPEIARGQSFTDITPGPAGIGPGRFIASHGVAVDSRGDVGRFIAMSWLLTLWIAPFVAASANETEMRSAQCSALTAEDFSGIQDAPTQLTGAKLIEAQGQMPAYCQVHGYVAPQVGFDIRLPASNWNGKFLKVGCGGLCGVLLSERGACDDPLRRGYVCIASDLGHKGSFYKGLWAYNNLQAEIDYAYRGTHVAALAGKAITQRYYGMAPKRSYFMGCSKGGHQALMQAQRFPGDFDGIIAGAARVHMPINGMYYLWNFTAAQGQGGEAVFTPSAIQVLHEAAVAKCDLDDGVKDGIIGNPPACKFDPAAQLCRSGESDRCLTAAQAAAAEKIYAGITTSTGEPLYPGAPIGSELNWTLMLPMPDGSAGWAKEYGTDILRYLSMFPDLGPDWQPADIDFDRDYQRLDLMSSLHSASNPDLRRFKAAGGKLIAYHGWSDEMVAPTSTIDYYETVERTMGGRKATQDFFRLFLLAGVNHCSGGAGADAADHLGYLEAWVERGQAPDTILTAHIDRPPAGSVYPYRQFPADSTQVAFTRPVYPYPRRALYKGTGDPKLWQNFKPFDPQPSGN